MEERSRAAEERLSLECGSYLQTSTLQMEKGKKGKKNRKTGQRRVEIHILNDAAKLLQPPPFIARSTATFMQAHFEKVVTGGGGGGGWGCHSCYSMLDRRPLSGRVMKMTCCGSSQHVGVVEGDGGTGLMLFLVALWEYVVNLLAEGHASGEPRWEEGGGRVSGG